MCLDLIPFLLSSFSHFHFLFFHILIVKRGTKRSQSFRIPSSDQPANKVQKLTAIQARDQAMVDYIFSFSFPSIYPMKVRAAAEQHMPERHAFLRGASISPYQSPGKYFTVQREPLLTNYLGEGTTTICFPVWLTLWRTVWMSSLSPSQRLSGLGMLCLVSAVSAPSLWAICRSSTFLLYILFIFVVNHLLLHVFISEKQITHYRITSSV